MKKIILLVISLFNFTVKAKEYEFDYSQWTSEKPQNVDEILIESEVRYKFYKEKEVNVNYLGVDDINNNVIVDYNDYIFTDYSEESDIRPLDKEGREITYEKKSYTFDTKINGIYLSKHLSPGLQISEIKVFNGGKEVNYYTTSELSFLADGDIDTYKDIDTYFTFSLDDYYESSDISLEIYYKNNKNDYLSISYLAKNLFHTYVTKASVMKDNNILVINYKNMTSQRTFDLLYYKYRDILYKTYNVNREYLSDYYVNYDGYIKDVDNSKTFYRYIKNEYILVDFNNRIVKNSEYCIKEFCMVRYFPNKEENILEKNPYTYDNIYFYFIMIILFIILLILMKNKSTFVKSI